MGKRSTQPASRVIGSVRGRSGLRPRGGIDPGGITPDGPLVTGEAALAEMVVSLRDRLARTELVQGQTQQVGARLPASLVREAKRRTGLSSNTDLLTFALANVAMEDDFADAFETAHGKLDPGLDIGL